MDGPGPCAICEKEDCTCGTPLAELGKPPQFHEWANPPPEVLPVEEEANIQAPRDVYREEPVPGSARRRRVLAVRKGDMLTRSQARRYKIRPVEQPTPTTETT